MCGVCRAVCAIVGRTDQQKRSTQRQQQRRHWEPVRQLRRSSGDKRRAGTCADHQRRRSQAQWRPTGALWGPQRGWRRICRAQSLRHHQTESAAKAVAFWPHQQYVQQRLTLLPADVQRQTGIDIQDTVTAVCRNKMTAEKYQNSFVRELHQLCMLYRYSWSARMLCDFSQPPSKPRIQYGFYTIWHYHVLSATDQLHYYYSFIPG